MSVQETSIPTNPVKAANLCRILVQEGSVRLLSPLNSIQSSRPRQRPARERIQAPRNPDFRLRQPRNVRCTRNGSSCLPSRAALELALSQRESSNGGRTSNKSLGTVRPLIVYNNAESPSIGVSTGRILPNLPPPSSLRLYPDSSREGSGTGILAWAFPFHASFVMPLHNRAGVEGWC